MQRLEIVGTLHLPTARCDAMSLYSLILAIGPDTVFEEKPKGEPATGTGLTKDASALALEDEALAAYQATRPLRRLPYDMGLWPAESRRLGYLSVEKSCLDDLRAMAEAGNLSKKEVESLAQIESSRRIFDKLFSMSLAEMNQASIPSALEALEEAQTLFLGSACARHTELASFLPALKGIGELLARRRSLMAANILGELSASRPASALILCGLGEKGRLTAALKGGAEKIGYRLGDFWRDGG